MKHITEKYIGSTMNGAVITVPADFNILQCQATIDAGEIVGINVLRIIGKPTTAAIAYGLDHVEASRGRGMSSFFTSEATRIEIDYLFQGIDFFASVTRSKFEELNSDLFVKCMDTVEKCLADAQINKNAVDDVVLVGGSSRIPKIQQMLQDILNGKELCNKINPDEAVAFDAAVQAAILSDKGNEKVQGFKLVEVPPLSLGIRYKGDVMEVKLRLSASKVEAYRLSRDEIEKMIKEAKMYKAEDEKHWKKHEARLDFDTFVCRMRAKIKSSTDPKKAEDAINKAFQWLDAKQELAEVNEYEEKKSCRLSLRTQGLTTISLVKDGLDWIE
ncbi:OLC1v1024018C1 [Oldenlandia corymbosa var. corymbosa]|uniref:OLC1v1024018C1 n=1 Tax=Oldenlandia corymbosa var. corymbosa TaxID=529605 RepID=A0AAV1C1Q7_OLDCO|nr:OLC1v1024018C1 [Oldenlandia corymbosa var. corymbosa]